MAGQIKVNQLQLGDSLTATQNFVWQTNVDGTAKLARGNVGDTTQDILMVDAAGYVGIGIGPNIKRAKFTGVTGAAAATNTVIPHGLSDYTKIISIEGVVAAGGTTRLPFNYTDTTQAVGAYATSTDIIVRTGVATNTAVWGKAFVVLITYEA